MATKRPEALLVQVAMPAPPALLDGVRAWCVGHGVGVRVFVAEAIREKLRRARIR